MVLIVSYFSLFLLVFDLAVPPVKFIGSAPFSLLLTLSVLLLKRPKILTGSIKHFFSPFYVYYFIVVFFVVLRVLFSGEFDYLLSMMKSMVIFTAAVLYLLVFGCDKLNDKLINIFFANAVVCFVAGTFPSILELVYFFKSGSPEPGFIPYRNAFLAGSGYFGISSVYSVIILVSTHKLVKDGFSLSLSLKFLLIVGAGVIAGRTTFIGLAISIIYLMTKSVKYSLLVLCLIAILVSVILSVDSLSIYSSWLFEFFSLDDGSISLSRTASTNELETMYFMPSNDMTWLFGDGRYVDGDAYYMHTDAGYMRNLFFGGVPFVMAVASFAILSAYKSKSNFYIFFALPLLLLLHYKGAFILNNPAGVPLVILLSFWFNSERKLL